MFPPSLVADAEALYRQYHRAVYAYLVRLTSDPDWAEDLLQETFYRAIVHAASYRGDAAPLSWLCAIGRNLQITQGKRRSGARDKLVFDATSRPPEPEAGPETAVIRMEQWGRISRTLGTLPETQRMALLLRDWDGLPYETIAEILDLTLANVKVTIHRARARFRERYGRGGTDDD